MDVLMEGEMGMPMGEVGRPRSRSMSYSSLPASSTGEEADPRTAKRLFVRGWDLSVSVGARPRFGKTHSYSGKG